MEIERLFIAALADTANDEFHVFVVDGTAQSDPLSQGEAIELYQLRPDDCPLPVADKRLPLSIRHIEFRVYLAQLGGIHRKVREKVFLVLVDASEPAEWHNLLYPRQGGNPLLLGG